MNKPETYKTNHPTIKEITIGDQFVLNNGEIVTFTKGEDNFHIDYPFVFGDRTYTLSLQWYDNIVTSSYDIKYKYIPLQVKIGLL